MTDSTAVSQKQGFLAAFRYRNYRFLWGSGLAFATGISMEMVVIGWLVLELTDSPILVGLVGASRYAGMGLGPLFGALADRFDRRRILILSRAAASIYALALAVLYYSSLLEVWHIFALVLFASVVRGFNMPTANALAADTVEKHNLASAVAMLMVGMSTTRMVGSLMGGYLYDRIEAGGVFAVMTVAYSLASLFLFPMRQVARERPVSQESVWKSVIAGIHYITNDRALLALMVFAAIANLFIFPLVIDMMPVFAREVLQVGASGLGWLIAAQGLGGLIGALVISVLGGFRYKGWLLIVLMIVWPLFMIVFAGSRLFYVSLALLVVLGVGRGIAMAIIQLLILTWTAEEFRGRVLGVRMFVVILEMVGSIIAGALVTLWGITTVMVVNALFSVFASILTILWAPQLRRRQ